MKSFSPQVMLNFNGHVVILFAKGRTYSHGVLCNGEIKLAKFGPSELRELRPAVNKVGDPYPVRKAASYHLNHSAQVITSRAKSVLRGLVKRAVIQPQP